MSSTVNQVLDDFMFMLEERNPQESEFLQAVKEVAESVLPYIEENPKYKGVLEQMVEPERTIIFRVVWTDDNQVVHVNRGYRVQFNSAIGPYKGGLRFHPTVSLSVLKFLGFEQTLKNSLTTLSLGGGKGGSDFNPKQKSDSEIMRFCQSFMTELSRHIGPNTDIPAGDIGVGGREIGFMYGQYKRLRNEFTGALTGKGIGWGGSLERVEATGYGAVYFTMEMLRKRAESNDDDNEKGSLEGMTLVISGSGNVALHAAEQCVAQGAKVVTLSDSTGYVFQEEGFSQDDISWIKEYKFTERGSIEKYVDKFGGNFFPREKPWGVKCDVAMPCATQNELDEDDAKALIDGGCICVTEGANMPCTADAVHYLRKSGILYAPGKAANAGGVAISGLEMAQNSQRQLWDKETVNDYLHTIMRDIHSSCCKYGENEDGIIDYVKGANLAGFIKVADAMIDQGIV